MRGGRRGSYFFVIDAFLGAAILIVTLIVMLNIYLQRSSPEQSFTYARDYLDFLTTTEVRDYHSPTIDLLIAQGNISNPSATIAEQLLYFHNTSRDDLVYVIINESIRILPGHVAVNVSVIDTGAELLYNRSTEGSEDRKVHQSVRGIEFVFINRSTLYGPVVLEVDVWV